MDDAKPNRKKRSPTEDKQLSYERDGRNAWGESPHGARRSIPKFKKQSTRQMRHGAKQVIAKSDLQGVSDERRLVLADAKGKHPAKRKMRDQPLGVKVEGKKWRNTPRSERSVAHTEEPPKEARETRNRRESVKSVLKPGATGPAIRKAGKRK